MLTYILIARSLRKTFKRSLAGTEKPFVYDFDHIIAVSSLKYLKFHFFETYYKKPKLKIKTEMNR